MTRGSERDFVSLDIAGDRTFVAKLSNDELRELRSKAERGDTTFGAGARVSLRVSDVLSIVEELLQRRKNDGL